MRLINAVVFLSLFSLAQPAHSTDGTKIARRACLATLFAAGLGAATYQWATQPSLSDYEQACYPVGVLKLAVQAQRTGRILEAGTVKVVQTDVRWYNPYKYIWFEGSSPAKNGQIERKYRTLVQYDSFSGEVR
ncbi:hypothetical protein K2X33_14045 [bacterium]|nr:hypothetical protein [bacterium]